MKSTTTLNGNMIKKVSSGGDEQTGRLHCGNEQEFLTHFLPICLANDVPTIKPYDGAVDNRLRVISYKKRFVSDPENDDELQKDDNIYNELKTKRFQRVFIGILIREVIKAKDEWIETGNNCIDTFLEEFEITNDEKDFVPSNDISEWIKEKNLGISAKKFGMEIKAYCKKNNFENVVSKLKKINGKTSQCWFGVKGCFE